MRSTAFAAALLFCLPALAAGEQSETLCTIKMNSTYRLSAPAGWRFVECSSGARDQNRNYSLEPLTPASLPQTALDTPGLTMYGGQVGRGTVEALLAKDREVHSGEFAPNDGEGLRTADRRDVRILQMTSRGEPFTWLAHGYVKVGPVVFLLALECHREEDCAAGYAAFKKLVGSLQALRPNEVNVR